MFNEKVEDFTFFDFAAQADRTRLKSNQFSINRKRKNQMLTFNKEVSCLAMERGLLFLRIRKDNITGDLHLVFTKDTGLPVTPTGTLKTNVLARSPQLISFLEKELCLPPGDSRCIALMSEDLSNSPDYLTFKILGKA